MIDKTELRRWWDLFVGDGNFTEVRILGKFQYSGYFKDFENLCKQLEPYTEMDDEQIYFVLNKIDESCYARPQCEKLVKSPKVTTKDDEIIRRNFLLLDFDPIRRSQTNSTPEQFELAHKKAQDVYRFLIKEKGFTDSIICISGNGWHILVPVDLPCNEETNKIIKDFYTYMGSIFSDENVEFDEKVYTNARLTKLYSTWAKKGANVPSNPWRQSKIIHIPKDIIPTPIEKIKELADMLPKEEGKPAPVVNKYRNTERFDLEQWLNAYGIEYRKKQEGGSTKYEIKTCPWHETHSTNNPYSSALFQDADGKITYTCAHSHCKNKQWKDFRLYYQPNAYDRPIYQPQYTPRQYAPQKPKYQIKEEIPELGEKWKSLSSIKRADMTMFEKVKTGFTELDRRISGLFMSEVTVLSGSNASGKSSWLNTLIHNIIEQDYKVALWSGEMRDDILKTWIHMPAAGKRNMLKSKYEDNRYYVPDSVAEKIDAWLEGRFFLYNNNYGTNAEQILSDMKILEKAGVKVFILDNMMAMDIDLFEGDKNNKQKELILRIKDFAKTKMVHIILVAHPRKAVAFLRKTDISGTGDIINAVDNCFIIHRTNEDFLHAVRDFYNPSVASQLGVFGNVLSVEKNRMFGVVDYFCGMYFEPESRRFKNTIDEDIHYGWEGVGGQEEMFQDTSEPFEGTYDEESDDPF